jgi:uncharacterized protein (TIGR01777 family)
VSRILLSGSTGFVGSRLLEYLRELGHEVIPLLRSSRKGAIVWDPVGRSFERSYFEGFHAFIHLGGEPLSLGRWGRAKQEAIRVSRVASTSFLAEIINALRAPPQVFICASAVGFYGDRGNELLDEQAGGGNGFLAHVCGEWEAAARGATRSRVVSTRFGVVLSRAGGALAKMEAAYRWGCGAVFGSGEQWMSWIGRNDLVRAIGWILEREEISGPVNCTAPEPLRQKAFASLFASALSRPLWLTVPAPLIRLGLGKAASEMLLFSARAMPEALRRSGFSFETPSFSSFLSQEYGHA